MVRRHLTLSIALASIVSLVAGGLAYAALTPEGKVSACVTADGFVRSASSTNRCPYKTTPVLLDKSTGSGPAGVQATSSIGSVPVRPGDENTTPVQEIYAANGIKIEFGCYPTPANYPPSNDAILKRKLSFTRAGAKYSGNVMGRSIFGERLTGGGPFLREGTEASIETSTTRHDQFDVSVFESGTTNATVDYHAWATGYSCKFVVRTMRYSLQ